MVTKKDPKRQRQGAINKAQGKRFEERLDTAFTFYRDKGYAAIEKTPEPMRPTKAIGDGKFIAFFAQKAQPDYTGTLKGGRALRFEAKYTSTDRLEHSKVIPAQAANLDLHQRLGARCFVIAGFSSGEVYLIPWDVWQNMKAHFGRKYVTEKDLGAYRVPTARNGSLMLLPVAAE